MLRLVLVCVFRRLCELLLHIVPFVGVRYSAAEFLLVVVYWDIVLNERVESLAGLAL